MLNKLIKRILVMMAVMTCITGAFIALMTYINLGFTSEYFSIWLKSVAFAVLVMLPLGGVFMFIANKIVKFTFPNQKVLIQNLIVGLIVGLSMEAIMAVSTTINLIGFTSFESFSATWLKSYIAVLPFAVLFAPIMTIIIKPRLEAYLEIKL